MALLLSYKKPKFCKLESDRISYRSVQIVQKSSSVKRCKDKACRTDTYMVFSQSHPTMFSQRCWFLNNAYITRDKVDFRRRQKNIPRKTILLKNAEENIQFIFWNLSRFFSWQESLLCQNIFSNNKKGFCNVLFLLILKLFWFLIMVTLGKMKNESSTNAAFSLAAQQLTIRTSSFE